MLAEGLAGRFVQKVFGNAVASFTTNQSLRVANALEADGDEATRAGLRFIMNASGATGIAPVQALPSTAAQWLIYNPAANVVSAFLDVIGMSLATGTAGAGGELLMCPVRPTFVPATVPVASSANVQIMNASPAAGRGSNLIVASGQTLQGAAVGNWVPIAPMSPVGTVLGQTVFEQRDLKGKIVIPPGCGLGLCVISPTGTSPLFTPFAMWREYASDLES